MDSKESWLGFKVIYRLDPRLTISEQEEVAWAFIIQAIEENKLFYHGGGRAHTHGFANAEHPASATEAQRQEVSDWLAGHPNVLEFEVGRLEVESA